MGKHYANMKVSEQCSIAAYQGNQVPRMIRRNITYQEYEHKSIVRYHSMHGCHIAGRTFTYMLAKLQMKATKLRPED